MNIHTTRCCGIREIDKLGTYSTPERALRAIVRHELFDVDTPLYLFTGVSLRRVEDHTYVSRTDDYGQALADYITANRLGTVVVSPEVLNPHSGNCIKAWIWAVDADAIEAWRGENA
jgi:hypothetical protein